MSKVKIKTVVQDLNDPNKIHPSAALFSSDEDMPEIKSVGFGRVSKTSNSWISYVITTKGNEVISVEVDEPNLRQIAEESAKVSFINLFTDID